MKWYKFEHYPIASFKAEIWHKVEESVPKQSGSIALHKSFLQGKYCTQFCLFVLANQMQASKTQIFGYLCYLLFFSMPSSRLKCGKKLRNISPSRFISTPLYKSSLQAKYVKYCMWSHEFWVFVLANQMHAFKTKILGTLWPLFCFLNAFYKALIWDNAEEYVLK